MLTPFLISFQPSDLSDKAAAARTPLSESFCQPSTLFAGMQPVTLSIHDNNYPLRNISFGIKAPDRVRAWPLRPAPAQHRYSRALTPGSIELSGTGLERLAYFTVTTCFGPIPAGYPQGVAPPREYRVRRTYCNEIMPPSILNTSCQGYFNPYFAYQRIGNQQIRKKTCLPGRIQASSLTGIQVSAGLVRLPEASSSSLGPVIPVHLRSTIKRDDTANCLVRI